MQQSIIMTNMTLDEVNDTFMSYREEFKEGLSQSSSRNLDLKASSAYDDSPEKSSQNSY